MDCLKMRGGVEGQKWMERTCRSIREAQSGHWHWPSREPGVRLPRLRGECKHPGTGRSNAANQIHPN